METLYWGTQQESGKDCEKQLVAITEKEQEHKYDWNYSKAIREMLNQGDSL